MYAIANILSCSSFPALLTSGSPLHEATDTSLAVEKCDMPLWFKQNAVSRRLYKIKYK
jgi:hypothetical protein